MKQKLSLSFALITSILFFAGFAAGQTSTAKVDSDTISGLGARNIGSAAMSGRIAAVDAVQEGQRLTIYVGSASGGVWKSVNGGTTFKPVFDKEAVQSIGAVTIDPKNPKVIWVGTGESWTRNSVSIGDGVYKSTDGGETWTNMGLRDSERITKILVNPNQTNTVYVCAPGKLWSDSEERGLYKTSDGGKSWSKILYIDPNTGIIDMVMSPTNPDNPFHSRLSSRFKLPFLSSLSGAKLMKDLPSLTPQHDAAARS